MKDLILILLALTSWLSSLAQVCKPGSVPSNSIRKAVALAEYNGFRFTGTLVNNNDEDGRYFFITSSYPFKGECASGATPSNTTINNISFAWVNSSITQGADLLEADEEIAVLELHQSPPFNTISYLGVDMPADLNNAEPERAISFYHNSSVPETFQTEYTVKPDAHVVAEVKTSCFNQVDSYTFNTNDFAAYKIEEWNEQWDFMQHEYAKGSPLLNTDLEVIGIYVTKTGSSDEESCGEDNAYFVSLSSHIDKLEGWFNEVDRGIAIEKCLDNELRDVEINNSETVKANLGVTGSAPIANGIEVIFRAGVEVNLEPGFESGDDFTAEIGPCINDVVSLPRSTRTFAGSGFIAEGQVEGVDLLQKKIKVYPTIVFDKLSLESKGLGFFELNIIDLQGRIQLTRKYVNLAENESVTLNITNLPSGLFFVSISSENYFETLKIIKK